MKPACQPECTKELCSPLHFSFIRLKLINAYPIASECILLTLLMLILVDTPLRCSNFVYFFQLYVGTSQVISQMIFQFVSSFITDRTEKFAPYFLLIVLILQLLIDIIFYIQPFVTPWFGGVFGMGNEWFVLVIFVFRASLLLQTTNSVLKIFKMRIQDILKLPVDQQLSSFNNISVTSDFIGRTSSILFAYIIVIALYKSNIINFEHAKNILFITMIFWGIVSIICCSTIHRSYCNLIDSKKPVSNFDGKEDAETDETIDLDLEIDEESNYIEENIEEILDEEMSDLDDPSLKDSFVLLKTIIYFKRSLIHFIRNRVLLCINIHVWSVVLILNFVNIVLRFSVTDPGEDKGNRLNFCNGLIINLVENQLYIELSRMGGALVFQFYMTQVRPKHYFRYVYLFFSILISLFISLIFLKPSPTVGSILLSFITVLVYLGMLYDMNMSGSIAHPKIAGFVYGLQGSMIQFLGFFPIGAAQLLNRNIINEKVIIGFCICIALWAGAFGFFISQKYKLLLERLFETEDNHRKSKCTKFFFG